MSRAIAAPLPDVTTTDAREILFGTDPLERIVAAETTDRELIYWTRAANDAITEHTERFCPWLLLSAPPGARYARVTELIGPGLSWLCEFDTWQQFLQASRPEAMPQEPSLIVQNALRQALMRSGRTLFKGMTMEEIVRMQVDIETTGLSPIAADARVLAIAVQDNRSLLTALHGDEADILRQFVALVAKSDPDVLEGHNIYGFDLPYIIARCKALHVPLTLGRDGTEPRMGRVRNFAIGGNRRPFAQVYIRGRHVLDTYLAVQRYDGARGALMSYGLKQVARAFGIAEPDRIELPRERLAEIFEADPELVLQYCKQDVIETGRLAEIVAPTEFYLTQMVPDGYGTVAVSGMGDRINAILLRAALARGHSPAVPGPVHGIAGGYTELRLSGVIRRVVKADAESLYPSLMLAYSIRPKTDTAGIFLPALRELTQRRLEAKAKARAEADPVMQRYWDGLQGSFKVLINSFYGYLGASGFNFNDGDAAEEITRRGREIVVALADRLEETGSRVIEVDTDGIYFVPPDGVQGEDAERDYVARMGAELPVGIRLAFDGRYRAMVSLKTKNYVLQSYDGTIVSTGASLRSRADERFGRDFVATAIELLLDGRQEEIGTLYRNLLQQLEERKVPIESLKRRERITPRTYTSALKARARAVAGNSSVGDYLMVYEKMDGSLALADDYADDENVAYYTEKLYKFACRLRDAMPNEFDRLIHAPPRRGITTGPEQLSLFEF